MTSPTVSVVVPSYNYEKILPMCIEGILRQTYPVSEVIIVDDHSTDGSLSVAQSFPVTVIQTPRNSGVAGARNAGADKSSGSIIFFVDADIVLYEDAVEQAVRLLVEDQQLASVCGIFDPEPLIIDSIWEEFRAFQGFIWRRSSLGKVTAGFFAMGAIKRSFFVQVGKFNSSLRQTEEVDYGHRLSKIGTIFLSDLVKGRHNDEYELVSMMRKVFKRARDRVPFYFHTRRPMKGFELPRRLLSTALIFLAILSLLASIFLFPLVAFLFGFLLLSIVLEFDIYRAAYARFGVAKGILFHLWYLMFHLVAGAGILSGVFCLVVSKGFREMYKVRDED